MPNAEHSDKRVEKHIPKTGMWLYLIPQEYFSKFGLNLFSNMIFPKRLNLISYCLFNMKQWNASEYFPTCQDLLF